MKLQLLVGANPRVSEGGPRVKLHKGIWRIVSDAIDSVLTHAHDELIHVTDGSCAAQIQFIKRGTESHINVHAELVA